MGMLKKIKGILSLSPGKRAETLNDEKATSEFNKKRQEKAGQEIGISEAIADTASNVAGRVRGVLRGIVDFGKGAFSIAADAVILPMSITGNVLRFGGDVIRGVARAPLIAADYLAEGLGTPLRWIKKFRNKIHTTLGTDPSGKKSENSSDSSKK